MTAALGVAACIVAAAAGAVNINGNGVSLNLPTTDLSSGSAQTNGAGARLVSAGTPHLGVVSTDPAGAKVIIEPMNAIAGNETGPVADFAADPLSGEDPLDVQFTDLSSGGLYEILSWSWDFDDGGPPGLEQHPNHSYIHAGAYTVTLTITTAGGTVSHTKPDYITVTQGLPATNRGRLLILVAAFTAVGAALARKPRKSSPNS